MSMIDRLEELAAKATGRPWRVAGHDDWTYVAVGDVADVTARKPNAEFIVAAVNALPDLLKLARATRAFSLKCSQPVITGYSDYGVGSYGSCGVCPECLTQAALESLFREDVP